MEKVNYKNSKVLIVDDVEEILNSIKETLSFEEIDCVGMSNPEEALEYLKINKVDVILLDYFMPQMNGEEFVTKVREFDNDTIIILQTGYADKIPPLEMMDKINIQGYFDKNKSIDELILLVKSAIKTSALLKQVTILNYKDEFVGKLVIGITDEVKSQTMNIALQNNIIKDVNNSTGDKEAINECCAVIKEELSKQGELLSTLNFNTIDTLGAVELFNIIKRLTFINLYKVSASIVTKECENYLLNCTPSNMIFILTEIVLYLANNGVKEILVECIKENDTIKIMVLNDKHYDSEFICRLNMLKGQDDNVSVSCENGLEIKIM